MKIQIKSAAFGFVLACLLLLAALAGLWFLEGDSRPIFRDHILPSGKTIKITSFNLVWGVYHEERKTNDDNFQVEYVSSFAHEDQRALNQEALEVFELIRPVSEQWGFNSATISIFPTIQRKGRYYIYAFTRAPDGTWTFIRHSAKVYIND